MALPDAPLTIYRAMGTLLMMRLLCLLEPRLLQQGQATQLVAWQWHTLSQLEVSHRQERGCQLSLVARGTAIDTHRMTAKSEQILRLWPFTMTFS